MSGFVRTERCSQLTGPADIFSLSLSFSPPWYNPATAVVHCGILNFMYFCHVKEEDYSPQIYYITSVQYYWPVLMYHKYKTVDICSFPKCTERQSDRIAEEHLCTFSRTSLISYFALYFLALLILVHPSQLFSVLAPLYFPLNSTFLYLVQL